MELKGIIFDLDGVITRTANVHFLAWKQTFQDVLQEKGEPTHFTYEDDYIPYVDGKPRYEGVQSFLESRGINLPYGNPSDSPEKETYCGIGNRKNDDFRDIVQKEGVELFTSTIEFIKQAQAQNIKTAVASSSKNCRFILEAVGLIDYFETIVDGNVTYDLNLKGKPQPDIFVKAAENMGLHPKESVVIEDAISGVQAGKNGNFGLVLGITRTGDKHALQANGGDIVVEDMEEISVEDMENWFKEGIDQDNWLLTYNQYSPENERLHEALTTTGNGYYGSRGAFESESIVNDLFYPGNYIAGLFNKLPSQIQDKTIYNNDFVNCPNWHLIRFKVDNEEPISLQNTEILDFKHQLNMKDAVVTRTIRCKDKQERITKIETERFADMTNPHYGVVRYSITPENYTGTVTFISGIDGAVINQGVARYRQLNSKHLETLNKEEVNGVIFLHTRTNASLVNIYMSSRNTLYTNDHSVVNTANRNIITEEEGIYETLSFEAEQNQTYSLEKITGIYTSKDPGIANPEEASKQDAQNAQDFDTIFREHRKQWHQLWKKADIQIEGDRFVQKVTRLHTYHLLVTASPHNKHLDAGMPARGLHGEAYRGHIFWDELYILPFYLKHFPDVGKALLRYRYRRLDDAREYAREHGFEGAMYPWQTADGGKEETQEIHYNPVSGTWGPDLSRRQRHVSIAIAYNMLEYYQHTNDSDFLEEFGGEIYFEICRFWASIATYDENDGRYHIKGVMGPDEFHEKYPGKPDEEGGINDNAYTNILTSWLLKRANDLFPDIPQSVKDKINLTEDEVKKWNDISSKLFVPMSKDGIIEQYAGYFDLAELDWDHYKEKYENIRRMDRILKSEDDAPDKYKVTKQADTLMTFYLLTPQEVQDTLYRMGYHFEDPIELLEKNYNYYIKRTSHGSTLSYVVHSFILKYLHTDQRSIWEWFINAMKSDIYDTQGGTTLESIHTGVMAGTLDIIIKNFAGLNMDKTIEITPQLPSHWDEVVFDLIYKGEAFCYTITPETIIVENPDDHKSQLSITANGETYSLNGQKYVKIPYKTDKK